MEFALRTPDPKISVRVTIGDTLRGLGQIGIRGLSQHFPSDLREPLTRLYPFFIVGGAAPAAWTIVIKRSLATIAGLATALDGGKAIRPSQHR
jgi:hypothetical protein